MQTPLKQYILVKLVPNNNGQTDKLPANSKGEVVDAHDSRHWMTYGDAQKAAEALGMRVGFVLTEADPYFCVDVDKCLSPDGQSWSELATEMCQTFYGCFIEASVSGKGLHIWGRYDGPAPQHKSKNVKLSIELYTRLRFICLGQPLQGDPNFNATSQLAVVVDKYFKDDAEPGASAEWTGHPVPEWQGTDDDSELLAIMLKSRGLSSIYGNKATFQQLWTADVDALARAYPSPKGDAYDRSSADAALAQHLAFWTGKNCERIKGFMKSSSLKREKWESRDDYLPRTILSACARQTQVYHRGKSSEPGVDQRMAGGFKTADQLPEVFEDCTYIISDHAVLVPGGAIVGSEQFRVLYGGFKFQLDDQKTTRNPWEAFTSCPSWRPPTVDGRCFRPELPPLKIVEDNGRLLVNTYIPVRVNQSEGDVTVFLQMIERTYPDPTDREMLLAYTAALVQYPGRKFGWAPLLQGPEGNGKTFFTTAVAESIGAKYCHTANAGEFAKSGSKFNAWIENKLFVAVHDIRIHNDEDMELLKPLLTDEKIEIQGKGRDQYTGDNRANFIFTSNHCNALKLTDGGRRYAPFASAQQSPEELADAGLTPQFYADLWDWARGRGPWENRPSGFSKIAHFLHNYKIPDMLNPATVATRAPRTSAWAKFVTASAGPAEQEIAEAIAQARPGFAGGWVSSLMLDRLLDERRVGKFAPLNSRPDLLKRFGYILCPALPGGRVTSEVLPDGGRPRLFVRSGHPAASITNPTLAMQKYTEAQLGNVAMTRRA